MCYRYNNVMCVTKIFGVIVAYLNSKTEMLLRGMGWLCIAFALCVVALNPSDNGLSAGILIAIGAQFLAQAKNIDDTNEKRSFFYLESCLLAYKEASDLLRDGNNKRGKWIAAGRALKHAKILATDVKEDAHCRVLELHRLKYRVIFHDAIAKKTGAFFTGPTTILCP